MKQSITVIISSVLTIGLLVSPVAAKANESNEGEVRNHVKMEKLNLLPSKEDFFKYIINNKGDSTSNLYKLLENYKAKFKNVEKANLVKEESKPKNSNTNTKEQKQVKKQEEIKTTEKPKSKVVVEKSEVKQEVNQEAKQEVKQEAKQEAKQEVKQEAKQEVKQEVDNKPVQAPVEEKATENVVKEPVVNKPVQVQQQEVQEQASQPVTEKEQAQVSNSVMLQVVELTNKEREKAGLAPFQVDTALMASAQEKSQDMQTNNYFSHQSPTLGSPFDQMKNRGIAYKAAGENIAQGQTTAQQVVQGWMDSPGHRANILDTKFTHIGVGYVASGNYWTQQFIQK